MKVRFLDTYYVSFVLESLLPQGSPLRRVVKSFSVNC